MTILLLIIKIYVKAIFFFNKFFPEVSKLAVLVHRQLSGDKYGLTRHSIHFSIWQKFKADNLLSYGVSWTKPCMLGFLVSDVLECIMMTGHYWVQWPLWPCVQCIMGRWVWSVGHREPLHQPTYIRSIWILHARMPVQSYCTGICALKIQTGDNSLFLPLKF